MPLHNGAADGQTQPATPVRCAAIAGRIDLEKAIKYPRLILLVDTAAGIGNAQHGLLAGRIEGQGECQASAGRRKAHGVVEQIAHHLAKLPLVCRAAKALRGVNQKLNCSVFCDTGKHVGRLAEDGIQINFFCKCDGSIRFSFCQ